MKQANVGGKFFVDLGQLIDVLLFSRQPKTRQRQTENKNKIGPKIPRSQQHNLNLNLSKFSPIGPKLCNRREKCKCRASRGFWPIAVVKI